MIVVGKVGEPGLIAPSTVVEVQDTKLEKNMVKDNSVARHVLVKERKRNLVKIKFALVKLIIDSFNNIQI